MAQARRMRSDKGFLDGQFLVAMPGMEDTRFSRSVVFICAHSEEGAMGLMINQATDRISFPDLLIQLDVIPAGPGIQLPAQARDMKVHRGGPVETGRGFVLHSADYFVESSTLLIDERVSLTATVDILRAIARGKGPEQALLALGYAGWGPGQLETEIQANGWLSVPATPELIFDRDLDAKYERALAHLGVELAMLSSEAGHA